MPVVNNISYIPTGIIAHRGASGYAPENTIPAMQMAKQLGAQWVEFDVTLSADGVPMVFHDKTLRRTTTGRGAITTKTLTKLKQLDAGSWLAPQYIGTTIPTLREMLQALADLGLQMNLEIKPHDSRIAELVEAILDELQLSWPTHLPQPLFSSFSHQAMTELRKRHKHAAMGLLMHRWQEEWQALAEEWQCVSVHVNRRILNARRVDNIKQTGRALLCYTVDDKIDAQQLLTHGVDAVFSNYPNLLTR
jgi:glycerophosphoryl diester phosphodiesterase